jgi:hypothetical protein
LTSLWSVIDKEVPGAELHPLQVFEYICREHTQRHHLKFYLKTSPKTTLTVHQCMLRHSNICHWGTVIQSFFFWRSSYFCSKWEQFRPKIHKHGQPPLPTKVDHQKKKKLLGLQFDDSGSCMVATGVQTNSSSSLAYGSSKCIHSGTHSVCNLKHHRQGCHASPYMVVKSAQNLGL